MSQTDFDAYTFQELMRPHDCVVQAKAQANRLNKHLVVHPYARTGKGGLSAGVAAASPWQYGLAELELDPSIQMPPPERFVMCSWFGLLYSGVPLISAYCYKGPGSNEANEHLMWQIAGVLFSLGRPYSCCRFQYVTSRS